MPLTIEVIPDPEFGGFTARVPDIPAYGEGATEDDAIADLREALRGYIDAFGLDDTFKEQNGFETQETIPCHTLSSTMSKPKP